ncbi:unnamed protein product [Miscanthus lutarioriparius]|uniref:Bifunctional inhibitor/plant lipid transfer protein/seed storage helical domain-containing protein n=1 Tax=Miscanthus lutarioriparius TaxID=422564 RepID=A0A811MRZ9_9POAL|nr:unnamed protein product [Miscanthus lutarioriparius]
MASRGRATAARFWLLAAASLLVAAASARSGPGECTSALVSLSPCVDYMCRDEATSALARCCSQLRSVARSRLQCLCAALGVDRTTALSLRVVCNVQTVSECESACSGSVGAGSTQAFEGEGDALPGTPLYGT